MHARSKPRHAGPYHRGPDQALLLAIAAPAVYLAVIVVVVLVADLYRI